MFENPEIEILKKEVERLKKEYAELMCVSMDQEELEEKLHKENERLKEENRYFKTTQNPDASFASVSLEHCISENQKLRSLLDRAKPLIGETGSYNDWDERHDQWLKDLEEMESGK